MAESDEESGGGGEGGNSGSKGGGGGGVGGEGELWTGREQDRFLPIANVSRIMKKALPGNAKISKEAKETVQECVSEFISFITGEASDKCQREKRKTVNGDDLLWAMTTLGFEDYVDPLKIYLQKFREIEGEKAGVGVPPPPNSSQPPHQKDSAGGGGGGGMMMMMMGQQMYGNHTVLYQNQNQNQYQHQHQHQHQHQMGMGDGSSSTSSSARGDRIL